MMKLGKLTVTRVWSKKLLRSAHKDASGESVLEYGPEEWWASTAEGNIAFYLGPTKPSIKEGDTIELIVVQKPSQPSEPSNGSNPPASS